VALPGQEPTPRSLPSRVPRRQLHDRYFLQAKREGYLARSAYKLKEIADRKGVLSPGQRVLDLGCAPGSWLQVAAERVGRGGRVVGVDLEPVDAPMPANVCHLVADVLSPDLRDRVRERCGEGALPVDVLLSDMAPRTSGAGDDFASAELCERVLELAPELLSPGGDLVMKILEGERYMEILRAAGDHFRESKGFKPKASRDVSREMYIVARGSRNIASSGDGPPGSHAARGADRA